MLKDLTSIVLDNGSGDDGDADEEDDIWSLPPGDRKELAEKIREETRGPQGTGKTATRAAITTESRGKRKIQVEISKKPQFSLFLPVKKLKSEFKLIKLNFLAALFKINFLQKIDFSIPKPHRKRHA